MFIGYKYRSHKFLGFVATEEAVSTDPGDTYLSFFTDNYCNFSICPVVRLQKKFRYFNACNVMGNHNKMRKYDLALEDI